MIKTKINKNDDYEVDLGLIRTVFCYPVLLFFT